MPYFLIKSEPVFLHTSLFERVRAEALKDKDAMFRASSMIAGRREGKEAEKLMFDYLEKQFEDDPIRFYSEIINFDLKEEEATENVWDLLYDYCFYYGCGYLADIRSDLGKTFADYVGNSYTYPMGKAFTLNLCKPPTTFLDKFLNRSKKQVQTIPIYVKEAKRIVGNLKESVVYFENFKMTLKENFNITTNSSSDF